jgi:membrane associated rhomboid family serine protease
MENSSEISNRRRVGNSLVSMSRPMRSQLLILGGFVLLIWLVELVDSLIFKGTLDQLGVQPRSLIGLRGVLLMPFLHGGVGHLLANTIPFLVLGALIMLGGVTSFFTVSAVIIVVSGLGVWLLGSADSVHLGASGLVFGFFGFLVTRAYFERSPGSILLAVVAIIFYGGIIWGILPLQTGVSWLAHLFGFFGCVLAAYLVSKRLRSITE